MNKLAIIGGTGVYHPDLLDDIQEQSCLTPYGEMTYVSGRYEGREIVFMTRHGKQHSIPPHRINYRANIYGLKRLGVTAIIATTAVGSTHLEVRPGEMMIPDQFLDFTHARPSTFFDGQPLPVAHVDMSMPYCPVLRELLATGLRELEVPFHETGTYVCTEGPRFETAAEVRMFHQLGGDIVGMTNVPECQLAREAEMAYATLSMVTNYGAGVSPTPLTHREVVEAMQQNSTRFSELLTWIFRHFDDDMDSPAFRAMAEYGGFQVQA